MRWKLPLLLASAVFAVHAAGCGGQSSEAVTRCTERIAGHARDAALSRSALERYAKRAYCGPFEERGWLYTDGTFKLDAYTRSRKCSVSEAGGPSHEVSCEEAEGGILDCGFLRFVRRSEAQRYIAGLKAKGPLRCDDGTPLEQIGAV